MSVDVATQESFLARVLVPRKPSRALLLTLSLLMVAWIALLIILYFTTIYPLRHSSPERAIVQANRAGRVL